MPIYRTNCLLRRVQLLIALLHIWFVQSRVLILLSLLYISETSAKSSKYR
ncbi:unnamed protein product [Strongylus vulgaris]|uniref:Uncharacterized protein n=1 Tax=Strongylus vulgaris TaxID=40348 RepID=A0A3P7IX91_STRVU|nr:unnamed protein product [Strongylus vulgaris]